MKYLFATIGAMLLMGSALAGSGEECSPELVIEVPTGSTYYVDNDLCQPECIFSFWIYEESDGEPGCSKGDSVVL